jgi:hemoglobin
VVAGLALNAAPVALARADEAHAQDKQTMPEKSLYERLGCVFAIAAVVDHFSDAVVKNPIVGQKSKNPQLREWHTKNLGRLPGLKFMRTLWVSNVSGGPFQFTATKPGATPLGLEEAHRDLRISPAEFDEVAAELGRTLDFFKVPKREGRSPGGLRRPQSTNRQCGGSTGLRCPSARAHRRPNDGPGDDPKWIPFRKRSPLISSSYGLRHGLLDP